jgi:hypothetical protein
MSDAKEPISIERWCLIVCLALGTVQAWILRYSMISDGVSYLDIGDAYFRGDWKAAINAYWSPVYSWCLGLALYLFKPSIWWEFVTVHLVNLAIYVGALFCFRFFLHSVLRSLREGRSTDAKDYVALPEDALVILGYSLFLWCVLVLIELGRVTPDLLVAGIVFLMAGYLVELRRNGSYAKFALFGALAGLAYLAKTIMFPVGFGFLAILLFSGKISKRRIFGLLLSAGVFLMVCSPFIFVLCKTKGRFTYGDSGRLAYANCVSPGTAQVDWQGEPAGSGIPVHPTRKILESPPVFEFGEPIRGTYPPWDDPSYFTEGERARFDLRSQIRVVIFSTLAYERFLIREPGLLAGVLLLVSMGGLAALRAIAGNWPLLAAAGLSLAAYALVLVLDRYIAASMVLLFVALFAGIRLPKDSQTISKYVAAAVALSVFLTVAVHISENAYATLTVGVDPPAKDQVKVALGLKEMGLPAGGKVAVIGYGLVNHWARLGRFRIVAEAPAPGPDVREFWASSPEARNLAYEHLKGSGAQAVIAWQPPKSALGERWKNISGTDYYVYFFQK